MVEILDKDAVRAQNRPLIGHGLPSAPVGSFDVPDRIENPEESFFHPVKAINDLIAAINKNTEQVNLLVKDMLRERTFVDRTAQIGLTVGYTVDYLEHKYVYIKSPTALTLNNAAGGTLTVPANAWTNLSLQRGTTVTVQGGSDSAPAVVTIRACDVPMLDTSNGVVTGTVAATESGVWTVQPGNTPNTMPWLTTDANNNASVPTGAANTVIKNAPGIIATIVVTTTGSGAGNVVLFDNATTNAGTPLFAFPATVNAGTSYLIFGWAKNGITAQNVANGPVFTVYYA